MRLALNGAGGRMGAAVLAAAAGRGFAVTGAIERPSAAQVGTRMGAAVVVDDPGVALAEADAVIDFSTPEGLAGLLAALPGAPVRALVVGVTGLPAALEAALRAAAGRLAVVRSGNFSVGVAVLESLVRDAAHRLGPDWDVEIIEAHHNQKRDAPSGTALMLGAAAAAGRGASLDALRLPAREGETGPRPPGGIGFAVVRGGGIVGDHDVMFAGRFETLRLSHHAADRSLFADGALTAAAWALRQPPGLYDMQDVLGLKRSG